MKKIRQYMFITAILVVMSAMVLACSKTDNENKESEHTVALRKVTHLQGETEIPAKPLRIADVSGSTEELLILGHKPVLTANTVDGKIYSHIIDKLDGTLATGHYGYGDKEINVEMVAMSEPDLIITNNFQQGIYDELSKIAPTIMLPYGVDQWRERFQEVGKYLGQEKEVEDWLTKYEEKASQVSKRIKAKIGNETFAVMELNDKSYRIYGSFGLGDLLFKDLKLPYVEGTPIDKFAEDLSEEGMTKFQPDHMFFAIVDGDEKKLKESLFWKNSKAANSGHVYMLDKEALWSKSTTPMGKDMLLDEVEDIIMKAK